MKKLKKINELIIEQTKKFSLSDKEVNDIKKSTDEVINNLKKSIKKLRLTNKVQLFIGGSLAKKTLIRKDKQDVDVFLRFKSNDELILFEDIMKNSGLKYLIVKGSRDYAKVEKNNLIVELIPVLMINNPKMADNITDLSYSHVNYVLKKIKNNKKLRNDIVLAKAFIHAANCYGAESYIRGFSGYAVELLIIHYKGFNNFVKAIANYKPKSENDKIIIDMNKDYKKRNILYEINESKLESPIIFIDPTFKERNVLAALSLETFNRFKKHCIGLINNPSEKFFEDKVFDEEAVIKKLGNGNKELGIFELTTNKQAGDIAGTKLLKFSKFFEKMMSKYFENTKTIFSYPDDGKKAMIYLSGRKIKESIIKGPEIIHLNHLTNFKKIHGKNAFIKGNRAYAKIIINKSMIEAFKEFTEKYSRTIKDMDITSIKLIKK